MMINLGIDLGTTNSAIAHYDGGRVTLFNNPRDFGRYTLPSVVAYRKDRTIIGAKAKEWQEKDSANVFARFKRKMGTSETWQVPATGATVNPMDLSAQVLRELKTFLPDGVPTDSVVITIPAAFDTIQSNATKEAGLLAGFSEVMLLQEPIAASLAYANQHANATLPDGKWMVFDLGGGTFDVALMEIKEGEMKVIDHEGDNFLGGTDFDRLIVEALVMPELARKYTFEDIGMAMKTSSGRLNAAYHLLLRKAEDAKIQLSGSISAEIFIDGIEDDAGTEVELEMSITQQDFNRIIEPHVEHAIDLLRKILENNQLDKTKLQFILLVGGSTYIPYVRRRLTEAFDIPLNANVDPTTCVAAGAAYYAGSKRKNMQAAANTQVADASGALVDVVRIKASYPTSTQEKEVWFAAKISDAQPGQQYRITRTDGGFDSGLKPVKETIGESLPLLPNQTNDFRFQLVDPQRGNIHTNLSDFSIACGYSISGQPLPADISLEVDDPLIPGSTKLLMIFPRNATLPLKKTIIRPLNFNLNANDLKQSIKINIVEGPSGASPESNRKIGFFEVFGKDLKRNVLKGSDIEISIRITESRDLFISAYISMAEQDFEKTFNPTQRHTTVDMLRTESARLIRDIRLSQASALKQEDYVKYGKINDLMAEAEKIHSEICDLAEDDSTDLRYQLEDQRRRLAQNYDELTGNDRLLEAWNEYEEYREMCEQLLLEVQINEYAKRYEDINNDAKRLFSEGRVHRIISKTEEMKELSSNLRVKSPSFLMMVFQYVCAKKMEMPNAQMADTLEEMGRRYMLERNWQGLANVCGQMYSLLPEAQLARNRGEGGIPESLRKNVGF